MTPILLATRQDLPPCMMEPTALLIQRGFAGLWQISADVSVHFVAHRGTGRTGEHTAVHAGVLHHAYAWHEAIFAPASL